MKINIFLALLFFLPNIILSQDLDDFTNANTNTGNVKIPGKWEKLNKSDDSGQIFFKNKEGIIIAIAKNPKNAYPFYQKEKSDFENVQEFYKWDSDYIKSNNIDTEKLKENSEKKYIIWKYNDKKSDNVFLLGSVANNFINLLIYTDIWPEDKKIEFLENLYQINK
ncbi:hypothetical protein SAMN05421847_0655 [Halpernia humi]|uniref:Uncharacterized protein n=1 Tax=Halpernia humi TaxID=493375 RepID=A0A1H5U343_9FLAO|nr:hypothetical protein [Halpernia humi]SEF69473.1 hypothetical protein SAMN05421847_0655 [Halpernia humi]